MTPAPCRASHLLALVLACVPHTPRGPLASVAPTRLRHLHRRQGITWRAVHMSSAAGDSAGGSRGGRGAAAASGGVTPVGAPPEESRSQGGPALRERRGSDTGVLNKVPLVRSSALVTAAADSLLL